jgi:hypothetical protein
MQGGQVEKKKFTSVGPLSWVASAVGRPVSRLGRTVAGAAWPTRASGM